MMAHGPVNTKFGLSINASVWYTITQSQYENVRELAQIIRVDVRGKVTTKTAIVVSLTGIIDEIKQSMVNDGYTTTNDRVYGKVHAQEVVFDE